jgi:hypothetical protein
VVDYIALEKENITADDVSGRVGGLFGSAIAWEQQDDRLVGRIKSTTPFGLIPQTQWTIDVELRFSTGGSYRVTTWVADGDSGEIVSNRPSITLVVETRDPTPPAPEPEEPNSTNGSLPSFLPFLSTAPDAPTAPTTYNIAARD